MTPRYEIFRYFGNRVFDAESYERTATLQDVFATRGCGYYLAISESDQFPIVNPTVQFIGPFADLGGARSAAKELQRGQAPAMLPIPGLAGTDTTDTGASERALAMPRNYPAAD